MKDKPKNPIEAEADMLQKSIRAAIDKFPPKGKDAFYQAIADALRKAFNTDVNILKRPSPVKSRKVPKSACKFHSE